MKLKQLIKKLPGVVVKGSKEIEIKGISANSGSVLPGDLFVAKQGITHHGARFASDAVAAGAVAVLSDLHDPFLEGVVQLITSDVDMAEAHLAARLFNTPQNQLFLLGITGTSGKTTTSYLCKHLLEKMGGKCGLIGTVEWIDGKHKLVPTHTTPDLITNYKLLHEMVKNGCSAVVMEVASHALAQKRVHSLDFGAAIFTNLSPEHLDYHKTMEAYASEKAKLFTSLKPDKVAIINADDPWSKRVVQECTAPILTYGIDEEADVRATNLLLTSKGILCTITHAGAQVRFSCGLIGRFNVYNCLAAFAFGISRGLGLETISSMLLTVKNVPGRLERVPNKKGISIFVDYAHKPDALRSVLQTLSEMKKGKIITVFGCGGNRDPFKRPQMAAFAEQFSDQVIVTSDNPRGEDPQTIIEAILGGFKTACKVIVESDRRKAIWRAIESAKEGDIVLIAGKGHEKYQIFAHQTLPFDDVQVASEAAAS
jgi:UDP-N-acetylmuramoyl-L-alanyl-D-glutamate--2,6-diaminopimelate ligase